MGASTSSFPESITPLSLSSSSSMGASTSTFPESPKNTLDRASIDQSNNRADLIETGDKKSASEESDFSLFMKGGCCKEIYTEWDKCVSEAEKKQEDVFDKCFNVTSKLRKCMESDSDYYGPVLSPEKAAKEEEEVSKDGRFSLFMKGGCCKEKFTDWEKCVAEAEKTQEDAVDKCLNVTSKLRKCMEAHSDYYGPLLSPEKAPEVSKDGRFSLFMKGGCCKETFTDWEKCVAEAEKTQEDVFDKCLNVTLMLKKCMNASDYYEPLLRTQKAAEEEVAKEG